MPTALLPAAEQIIDQLASGVLVTDPELVIGRVNATGEALLGTSAVQLEGRFLGEVPALAERLEAARRALGGGHGVIERSVPLGASMLDVHYRPMDDPPGLVMELVPLDRNLELAEQDLRERQQRALAELLRGLAHEIKNPLGGLRGAAQLLERQLDDPELTEYTGVIIAEADRLAALVDRIQNPAEPVSLEPVNVHEVLEHVARVTEAAQGEGLTLNRDYDPSIPDLLGHRDRLVQLMLNLVRNAGEAGADTVVLGSRIRRGALVPGGSKRPVAALSVHDNGEGVPEAIRPALFYPLVTGRSDGTGLGLAIAQRIAAEHGGVIRFDSRPGDTTFTVLLPLDGPANPEAAP